MMSKSQEVYEERLEKGWRIIEQKIDDGDYAEAERLTGRWMDLLHVYETYMDSKRSKSS